MRPEARLIVPTAQLAHFKVEGGWCDEENLQVRGETKANKKANEMKEI
jgi:hypothetical protein